jgi:hypothetical protein
MHSVDSLSHAVLAVAIFSSSVLKAPGRAPPPGTAPPRGVHGMAFCVDNLSRRFCVSCVIPPGRETLFEEDLSEKEVEEELAPLTVQLAYVLGRLGRTAEAQEVHDKVWWCVCVCVCALVGESRVVCEVVHKEMASCCILLC